jgi:hypothetical protein
VEDEGGGADKQLLAQFFGRALQLAGRAQTGCWMTRMTRWFSCSTSAVMGGRVVAGDDKPSDGRRSWEEACASKQKCCKGSTPAQCHAGIRPQPTWGGSVHRWLPTQSASWCGGMVTGLKVGACGSGYRVPRLTLFGPLTSGPSSI